MAKLLGIDIGTSGCKCIVIDETGRVLKQASAEYPLFTPKPMWTEQDPEAWWSGVLKCLSELNEPNVDAIGVTGQMHGSVFLDASGNVVRPALLWNDQRTVAECEEIERTLGRDTLFKIAKNPMLTGFQAPKLLWLRNHEPSNFAKVAQVLLPKDYIRYKLTGVFATEVSDASGVGLLDVSARQWSKELITSLNFDIDLFPQVVESDEITGHTRGVASLADGIPVVGGGGDQAAAAVGTGAVVPGVTSVSLGTSGVVFTSLDQPSHDPSGAAHVFCHANRAWHAMGVMLSCGGALRWYRDTLGGGRNYNQITASAATTPTGSEGLVFLPYLAGERCPHNNPSATGSFTGLHLGHTQAHFDRAVLEGITFGLLDGFRLLKGLGASSTEVRVTGGGAGSDFWVQIIANAFEAPCVLLESDEGPAMGSAILAGVGTGVFESVKEAAEQTIRTRKVVQPNESLSQNSYDKFRSVYHSLT